MKYTFALLISFVLCCGYIHAQDGRYDVIEDQLIVLSQTSSPGLAEQADIYVSKSSLQMLLAGLGKSHRLNLSVDPNLELQVSVSFTQETVLNILMYLLKKYDLDYQITGSIISITKFQPPPPPAIERQLGINYEKSKNELSLDLKSDTLPIVLKKITQLSGKNIFITPELNNKIVTVYLQSLPFENALYKLATANDLELVTNEDGTYQLNAKSKSELGNSSTTGTKPGAAKGQNKGIDPNLEYKITEDINKNKLITINAKNQPVNDIVQKISDELGMNYVLLDEIKSNTTVRLNEVTYDDFLSYVLAATNYTYKNMNKVYVLGERGKEGLRATEVFQLQYRSLEQVMEIIPTELKKGVEIKEFKELNSIMLSGSSPNIQEIKKMIDQLDKPVPVVMIELIIMDVNRNFNISTGITAGVGDAPVKTGGTVLPGIDLTVGGGTINNILSLMGLANLGGVGPNFYLNLKAMETNGYVDIQSTPRLSTLNGHEATINIGNKDYYLEQTQNVVGTQNPQTIVTNTYKPVNADFSITINPMVSGDEQITLDVTVNQSDFTTRSSPGAPPGQSERKFKSMIRVKNNDMIVLGGLEKSQRGDTGKGIPGLARIPVLKWLFSSRERVKQKSKLIILIKPSIIY